MSRLAIEGGPFFGPGAAGGGVAFSRDPESGCRRLTGEYFVHDPGKAPRQGVGHTRPLVTMEAEWPEAFEALRKVVARLEREAKDAVSVDFAVEDGHFVVVDVRPLLRSAAAAVRIAVNMADEGLISRQDAVAMVTPRQMEQLLHAQVDERALAGLKRLTEGEAVSPAVVSGRAAFDSRDALIQAARGERVILIRHDVGIGDIPALERAAGLWLVGGSPAAHGAVLARGMGIGCIVGGRDVRLDEAAGRLVAGGAVVERGQWLTLDGRTGAVLHGSVSAALPRLPEDAARLLSWADEIRRLGVRANADTPAAAVAAFARGAEGIGLFRTEHMFVLPERIDVLRALMVAPEGARRQALLGRLGQWMREDLRALFVAAQERPVAVRLLDVAYSEWRPGTSEELGRMAQLLGMTVEDAAAAVARRRELNPMLGQRGVRLAVVHKDLYEMQMEAIVEAAADAQEETGRPVTPEVIVPFVADVGEWRHVRERLQKRAHQVAARRGLPLAWKLGVMVEVPRAAFIAHRLAEDADFLSFGTNDLTQLMYGMCRDDGARFRPEYVENGLWPADPFVVLDEEGVGVLIQMVLQQRDGPRIPVAVCGEHGGDPASVAFFHRVGVDYVSCSPWRVPAARLAAARAALGLAEERGA